MPKPDAVLLILDSTNLSRHLVLAAPVLSLGLPTLVILNMADDLDRGGGEIDSAELAMQLGTPVALVSAAKGHGVDKVFQFLAGTTAGRGAAKAADGAAGHPGHPQVPRLGRERRQQGEISCARAALVDPAPGRDFPASGRRPAGVSAGGDRRSSNHFLRRAIR